MDNPDYLITLIGIAAPIVATFFGIFLQSYLQKKKKGSVAKNHNMEVKI